MPGLRPGLRALDMLNETVKFEIFRKPLMRLLGYENRVDKVITRPLPPFLGRSATVEPGDSI